MHIRRSERLMIQSTITQMVIFNSLSCALISQHFFLSFVGTYQSNGGTVFETNAAYNKTSTSKLFIVTLNLNSCAIITILSYICNGTFTYSYFQQIAFEYDECLGFVNFLEWKYFDSVGQ